MSLFSRSKHNLETIAVDFLPFDQQLHLIIADADMNLQVLQFDPDSTSLLLTSRLTHPHTRLTHPPHRPQIRSRLPPPPQIHLPHRPLPHLPPPRPIPPIPPFHNRRLHIQRQPRRHRRRRHGHHNPLPVIHPTTPPPNPAHNTIRHPRPAHTSNRGFLSSFI